MYIENVAFIVTIDEDENPATMIHGLPTDPFIIGLVLVDVARTYARAFQEDSGTTTDEEYLQRIKEGFDAEWANPTSELSLETRLYPPKEPS